MSVQDAKPSDLYVDATGKVWRVVSVCTEPTVTVQEVEKTRGHANPIQKSGGISALMWEGFKRVWQSPA